MEAEEVSSSSSSESMLRDSNVEFTEKSDEDGGVLLVPRSSKLPRQSNKEVLVIDENEKKVGSSSGCSSFFLGCVVTERSRPIIQRSPRGKKADEILHFLSEKVEDQMAEIAVCLIPRSMCLTSDAELKFPSASQGKLWSNFYKLRCSEEVKRIWKSYVLSIQAPTQECDLALQLLLETMLKKMLEKKANELSHRVTCKTTALTIREKSAIRYMAGYVAVTLLRHYRKPSPNPEIQLKRYLFVSVLRQMSAEHQPESVDSLADYFQLWSELIDHGGLYHINDQKVRDYSGVHLPQCIAEDVVEVESVLSHWEAIAFTIPQKYEKYSLELLRIVVDLWITIRTHAFAKEWTMHFERRYQKGTRKSLQAKRKSQVSANIS